MTHWRPRLVVNLTAGLPEYHVMKHHILLVGTRHGYQFGAQAFVVGSPCTPPQEQAFRGYVKSLIQEHRPYLIVEELNEDGVREAGVPMTVLQDVAQVNGIRHVFCEPNRAQRHALGIRDDGTIRSDAFLQEIEPHEVELEIARQLRRQFDLREEFWCARLTELPVGRVLVVCGANHVPTFSARVRGLGAQCDVLNAYWLAPGDTPTSR